MTVPLRAALYLRVSTARQAEHDISIPDQRRQGEAYCAARGHQLVETFVEPGSTATNDRRPEFQRMIESGSAKPAPFDIVLVHSFSRFFRDHFELEFYVRKLAKNGIKLVSITQEIGDDPMHVMMRQMMALFDEYQSKENGKHTLRAMKENARQGFWNGSRPPIGYRIVAAEQRGAKVKKKLEIDPLHADTVRLIYRLALEGDGTSGPMGVKNITTYLNARHIFTRDGGRWGIGQLHRVLTRTTYVGCHEFNKSSPKSGQKPAGEVVTAEVPPLIDQATFDAVQAHLRARNPKVTPARVVSGPTLLTGICFCAACGGAMTLRTGKGGRYRYYTCSIKARQGETGCKGRSIPMEKLDDLVAGHIEDRLLQPERLEEVLASVLDRRQERAERRHEHIAELNKRAAEADLRLKRLYDAIESGVADLEDPALKDRIAGLKSTRDQAQCRRGADGRRPRKRRATDHHTGHGSEVRRDRPRAACGSLAAATVVTIFAHSPSASRSQMARSASWDRRAIYSRTLAAASGVKSATLGVRSSVPKWRPVGTPNTTIRLDQVRSYVSGKCRYMLERSEGCRRARQVDTPDAGAAPAYRHRGDRRDRAAVRSRARGDGAAMRARRQTHPSQLYAAAQEMELLGLTEDGRLVLWDTGRVIPVSQFQYRRDKQGRRWIDEGKFVLDWFGSEVVAHLGNLTDGRVSVALMCNAGRTFAFTRRQIRPMLRYKVIPDPEVQAEILAKLQELVRLAAARHDTPERQRGDHANRGLFHRPEGAPA